MIRKYKMMSLICIATIVVMLGLNSCADSSVITEEPKKEKSEEVHTMRMKLDVNRTEFDAEPSKATDDGKWEDGDQIFLRFETDNGIVLGDAKYVADTDEWVVNFTGTLNVGVVSKVDVLYFLGRYSVSGIDDKRIFLDGNNGLFRDKSAIYKYEDKKLYISANLCPCMSRIRFKRSIADAQEISVGGVSFLSKYVLSEDSIYTSRDYEYEVIYSSDDDGYTNYIYYYRDLDKDKKLKLIHSDTDVCYSIDFLSNMGEIGKSGWMNIPTSDSHRGWTVNLLEGYENGEKWVDLDLPSGNKWAIYDSYSYAWGETNEQSYKETTGNIIQGGGDDTARSYLGGNWCMPTWQNFYELIQYCKSYYYSSIITFRGNNDMELNFNIIDVYTKDYWVADSSSDYGFVFKMDKSLDLCKVEGVDKTSKKRIRAVILNE